MAKLLLMCFLFFVSISVNSATIPYPDYGVPIYPYSDGEYTEAGVVLTIVNDDGTEIIGEKLSRDPVTNELYGKDKIYFFTIAEANEFVESSIYAEVDEYNYSYIEHKLTWHLQTFVSVSKPKAYSFAGSVPIPYDRRFLTPDFPYARAADGCSTPVDLAGEINVDFTPSCNAHDQCYFTLGKSKNQCDLDFQKDMRAQCEADYPGIIGYDNYIACSNAADAYYTGVRVNVPKTWLSDLGLYDASDAEDAYNTNQAIQVKYEEYVYPIIGKFMGPIIAINSLLLN